jgi:hypothetical protein
MALFVLGAGATRGCSFVDPKVSPCLPPLDADFFTQLQRISKEKHKSLVREVMNDIVELFGHNFDVTLETVFTTLEHTIRMVDFKGDNRDFKKSDFEAKRDRLKQAIAAVLEDSLTEDKTSKPIRCENHKSFVEKIIEPKDVILSYNYDCTIDHALQEHGKGKWHPRYGYGFNLGARGTNLTGDQYWIPKGPQKDSRDTCYLYKLHGSLNFQIKEPRKESTAKSKVHLKKDPYTKRNGELQFDIIPPEWNKKYDRGVYADLWKHAGDSIYQAEHIVLIGYALPPTDLHSSTLFRTSLNNKGLKSLVIVNPDPVARREIRKAFLRGIVSNAPKTGRSTKVLSFNYWEEFLAANRSLWEKE